MPRLRRRAAAATWRWLSPVRRARSWASRSEPWHGRRRRRASSRRRGAASGRGGLDERPTAPAGRSEPRRRRRRPPPRRRQPGSPRRPASLGVDHGHRRGQVDGDLGTRPIPPSRATGDREVMGPALGASEPVVDRASNQLMGESVVAGAIVADDARPDGVLERRDRCAHRTRAVAARRLGSKFVPITDAISSRPRAGCSRRSRRAATTSRTPSGLAMSVEVACDGPSTVVTPDVSGLDEVQPQLDEQEGVAVGLAGEDVDGRRGGRRRSDGRRRQRRSPGDAVDVETRERKTGRRRGGGAARARPTGGHRLCRRVSSGTTEDHGVGQALIADHLVQEVDGRSAAPVQIVEYQEQRPVGGERRRSPRSRREQAAPARHQGRRDLTGLGRPSSAAATGRVAASSARPGQSDR